MSSPLRRIGIGFGRVKIWHDGLGEFSRQLGLQLAQQAPLLRDKHGIELYFHLGRPWHGMFGDAVMYLPLRPSQRLFHVRYPRFDLWHTLTQHNRFLPPVNARHRLLTVHDLNFLYGGGEQERAQNLAHLQRVVSRQSAVATISRYVRGDVLAHLQPTGDVRVVYNGAADLTSLARQAILGLEPEGYLLHISRMADNKNVGCLLDLAAEMPHRRFVLAGPRNREVEAVRADADARRLRNVTVLTDVSEAQKAWLYAHCRGFLPPLEAMHFGKPVFLSRLTSLPEVGGQVACYFDHFDARHMRSVVESGLADAARPGQHEALVAHAQSFTWARCAADYLNAYRTFLDSTPG